MLPIDLLPRDYPREPTSAITAHELIEYRLNSDRDSPCVATTFDVVAALGWSCHIQVEFNALLRLVDHNIEYREAAAVRKMDCVIAHAWQDSSEIPLTKPDNKNRRFRQLTAICCGSQDTNG